MKKSALLSGIELYAYSFKIEKKFWMSKNSCKFQVLK